MHRRTLIASTAALVIATPAFLTITAPAFAADTDPENTIYLDLKHGRVVIRLLPDVAPKTVTQIKTLARQGFYDGTPFHRAVALSGVAALPRVRGGVDGPLTQLAAALFGSGWHVDLMNQGFHSPAQITT